MNDYFTAPNIPNAFYGPHNAFNTYGLYILIDLKTKS